MRVLVLTNFLAEWTGSEVVALEVAEHFNATTSSFWCVEPMRPVLKDWRQLSEINLSDFDLVWAQHHAILSLLDRHDGSTRPFIVWASLSPYDIMEKLPPSLLHAYADLVVGNSEETAQARGAAISFGNAAPAAFHFGREHRPLRNILFVSNNQPPDMIEAAEALKKRGYSARFLGRNYEFKRLEPSDIAWADCVVSIGKTARYALASSTPVFIYDRFGGDGYLTNENYALNEANNFSGRPNVRKLSASEIADQIVANYSVWQPPPQPVLGDFLDDLAAKGSPVLFERHPDLEAVAAMSTVLGGLLYQSRKYQLDYQKLHSGEAGSWRWWASYTKAKLTRTARQALFRRSG